MAAEHLTLHLRLQPLPKPQLLAQARANLPIVPFGIGMRLNWAPTSRLDGMALP